MTSSATVSPTVEYQEESCNKEQRRRHEYRKISNLIFLLQILILYYHKFSCKKNSQQKIRKELNESFTKLFNQLPPTYSSRRMSKTSLLRQGDTLSISIFL